MDMTNSVAALREDLHAQGGHACHHLLMEALKDNTGQMAEEAAVVAWEHLHQGHWKDVHPVWRHAYSVASILKAATLQQRGQYAEAVQTLDLALLLGHPDYVCKDI